MQAVAHLFGIETPALAQCRVLELGCAVGGNIVPMAYSLPRATLVGIDLVASQIETAQKFAAASGVQNLELRAANIMDVTPQWGRFDYVIAHGVFSWVPHEVAEKVLQICAEQLTPNGDWFSHVGQEMLRLGVMARRKGDWAWPLGYAVGAAGWLYLKIERPHPSTELACFGWH